MRTTIDIPDQLLRQIKARAALRGLKLKDYVTEALRASLYRSGPVDEVREASVDEETTQVVGEHCVLPLIRGQGGPALRTPERLHEILEGEEVERALRPDRR